MSAHPGPVLPAASAADDTGTLLRQMRRRIAAARDTAPPLPAAESAHALQQAAARADVGIALPPLAHLGPLRRVFATLVGRVALYFLRLVSVDQSRFNHLIVSAVGEANRRAGEHRAALQAALDGIETRIDQLDQRVATRYGEIEARHAALAARLSEADPAAALAALADDLRALRAQQAETLRTIDDLRATTAWVRTQTEVLRRRATAAPASGPGNGEAVRPPAATQTDTTIDAWMIAEACRGDEASLRERLRRYLPLFEGRHDVLDIGCGRGEFLDLLRDAGVPARGIDLDRDMALWCQEKGHDVVCADALDELARLPEASVGGVFCAQVVEHLATRDMLRLVELAARALRPDGVLVVETLNPESLLVLYRWFWVDLTHERLVHPQTLRIVFQTAGLRDIEVRFVPPPEGALRIPVLELAGADADQLARFNSATQYLNDLLYGSFDYAVIGVR